MNKHLQIAAALLVALPTLTFAQVRTEQTFEKGWKFTREDSKDFSQQTYDDTKWQSVTVPHDWAIYGPFSIENDKQKVAITQDGQKEALEHAGRTGGLPFVGVGWYRLNFEAPAFSSGKKATLIFDGAMSHARVYINGQEAGFWPYGYNSFHIDATPYLKAGEQNTLAVRLENETESSRWYPGAGLYRNVHLVIKEDAHITSWGTQLTTPVVKKDFARVNLKTRLDIPSGKAFTDYRIVTELKAPDGKVVASDEQQGTKYDEKIFNQHFVVDNPALWSPDSPALYSAVSKVYEGNTLKDEYTTPFGIRSIEIIPNKGFYLNGERTTFKGVCNHHDLGPLGVIANEAGIRRQIRILKDMGCNAIRTSHNMPAPELIRACDEMGMMIMSESFDEWKAAKLQNGYHKIFDEWAEKDLVNLIHQFRNNPSVVMWCIGNEVPDQGSAQGAKLCRMMQDIVHREDPTRPCTQGMDRVDAAIKSHVAAIMDIPGFNYRSNLYQKAYKALPQQVVLGSETASTVSSRGGYKFPVERKAGAKYDYHLSSYHDVEHCSWSDLPEDNFILSEGLPYERGEFVWTGFDYLGEPTPYYDDWPSHSSLFGIIDLAYLPKDRYYLYRSQWNKAAETLHILPHWNWPGREGEVTPVFVYTNYPTVELFINCKSQGKRTKDTTVKLDETENDEARRALARQKRYRLMWMDTRYEPGEVKAVAYDESGRKRTEQIVRTAGKPYRIVLKADKDTLDADLRDEDLAFVTVSVVDREGNLCPDSHQTLRFSFRGGGDYKAGANGNPVCLEPFGRPQMPVFNGQMTAIVAEKGQAGTLRLKAEAKGLKSAELVLAVKRTE